jgi:23S rRNA (cytosine1962-C5)-methyltransferase
MEYIIPSGWTDYELIDTGDREKLERFGPYILIRPEPQAVWSKSLPETKWEEMAHARFTRGRRQPLAFGSNVITSEPKQKQSPVTGHARGEERGTWSRNPTMPDQWWIGYRYREMQLKFRLGLTAFGHIGVFPEQAENWNFIYDRIMAMIDEGRRTRDDGIDPVSRIRQPASGIRILNLFAYTGGASLAAKAAGADVVHVDSVKPVLSWAREDMEASGLSGIRWVAEDALKFVRREVKRGNRYDGVILDPPAYGRGPEGEKWVLEEYIDELMGLCAELLSPQLSLRAQRGHAVGSPSSHVLRPSSFVILSLYSMGFSPLIGENLIRAHFGNMPEMQSGEIYFTDRAGRKLPLGTVVRFA